MELLKPFAVTGDREDFPVDTDPSGGVSIEKGYPLPYEQDPTEGGKFIERRTFNQMMYLVSKDTVDWKTQTFANWNSALTYPKNAIVKYTNGNIYVSKVASNTALPTNTTNWTIFDPSSLDLQFVKLTGVQTIADAKTFNTPPSVTRSVLFDDYQLVPKKYVVDNFVNNTGNQTIGGVKTFSSFPVTPSSIPNTDYQVANKKYVDNEISSVKGVGIEQTWQNLLASRSAGVTYTNSTGKPIFIAVYVELNAGSYGQMFINGVEISKSGDGTVQSIPRDTLILIVPNGSTYSVTLDGTISKWFELR